MNVARVKEPPSIAVAALGGRAWIGSADLRRNSEHSHVLKTSSVLLPVTIGVAK